MRNNNEEVSLTMHVNCDLINCTFHVYKKCIQFKIARACMCVCVDSLDENLEDVKFVYRGKECIERNLRNCHILRSEVYSEKSLRTSLPHVCIASGSRIIHKFLVQSGGTRNQPRLGALYRTVEWIFHVTSVNYKVARTKLMSQMSWLR